MKKYDKHFTGIIEFEVISPSNTMEHVGEKLKLSQFGEFCPDQSLRGYNIHFLLSNPLYYRISKIVDRGNVIEINPNEKLNIACEDGYVTSEEDKKLSILNKPFTNEDFKIKIIEPDLYIGMKVSYFDIEGTIIELEGYGNNGSNKDDYCVIKLEKPFKGSTIIEILKSSFDKKILGKN